MGYREDLRFYVCRDSSASVRKFHIRKIIYLGLHCDNDF